MESPHEFSVAHWGHEPQRLAEARSGPRVCEAQPARFMESSHGFPSAHRSHEPPPHPTFGHPLPLGGGKGRGEGAG